MPRRAAPVAFAVIFHAPDGHVMTDEELRAWGKSPRVATAFGRLRRAALDNEARQEAEAAAAGSTAAEGRNSA